jgi:hypothetical protein
MSEHEKVVLKLQPTATWVISLGLTVKSLHMTLVAAKELPADFADRADELLAAAQKFRNPAAQYNVACSWSLASGQGPADRRDRAAAKAVRILADLVDSTEFFALSLNVRHLDRDTDLDPLRGRPDFAEFLARARGREKPAKNP